MFFILRNQKSYVIGYQIRPYSVSIIIVTLTLKNLYPSKKKKLFGRK